MSCLLRMPTPPWQVTPLHSPDGLISSAFHIGDAMLQGNLMRSTLQRVEFQPLRGFPCLKLEHLRGINLVDRPPFSRVLFKVQNPCLLFAPWWYIQTYWKNADIMSSKVSQIKDSKNWNFRRDKPIYERFQLVFPPKALQLTLRSLLKYCRLHSQLKTAYPPGLNISICPNSCTPKTWHFEPPQKMEVWFQWTSPFPLDYFLASIRGNKRMQW